MCVCCVVWLVVSLADVAGHHGAGLPEGLPQPPPAGPPRQPGPGEGAAPGALHAARLRRRGEERHDLSVAPDEKALPSSSIIISAHHQHHHHHPPPWSRPP